MRVFGAIGRLDRQKGFDTLVTAFRTLPQADIALHLYGQGEEEASLRALAADDPRIHFKGFAADPTRPYAEVDAVVMPSRWEAYGLVAIEALSAGRPVICADIDGMRDHAESGAKVVPLESADDIQHALHCAIAGGLPLDAARRFSGMFEDAFLDAWQELIESLTDQTGCQDGIYVETTSAPDGSHRPPSCAKTAAAVARDIPRWVRIWCGWTANLRRSCVEDQDALAECAQPRQVRC